NNEASGGERVYILVVEEIYSDAKDYISIDSPMARAMLKKQVDEEFTVRTPEGDKEWFINSIEYNKQSAES
ncbi:GreA/GreB family elongation factor, partial [Escherichia coli]|nr:GreA/GreB family elongation factor [Escherichia coli]